jgi:hypothetical protein
MLKICIETFSRVWWWCDARWNVDVATAYWCDTVAVNVLYMSVPAVSLLILLNLSFCHFVFITVTLATTTSSAVVCTTYTHMIVVLYYYVQYIMYNCFTYCSCNFLQYLCAHIIARRKWNIIKNVVALFYELNQGEASVHNGNTLEQQLEYKE